MDMMESIAGMAMDMSAARFSIDYSMSFTKKVMETQELAVQEMLSMLPENPLPKGAVIDTYA